MKRITCLKLIFLLSCSLLFWRESYAQKQANNWYFGWNTGLNFNSRPPQLLTNGQAIGSWGHATISDANGNLLFYTSGDVNNNWPNLFDRRHIGMPNSISAGNTGSFGANALIVPWPSQPQKYFYFSRYVGPNGAYCSYSVVDMALNSGFGDISPSAKFQFVHSYDAIEVLGVQHRNNRDFWVIYQNDSTNIFSAYLISPTGLNLTPVVSTPAFSVGAYRGDTYLFAQSFPRWQNTGHDHERQSGSE